MSTTARTELLIELSSIQTQLQKRIDQSLFIHGISFTELMVMHHLNAAPEQTLRRVELAEKIALTASGVTRLLAPMEKIGLVHKELNPRDARVSLVKLSEAGAELYRDACVAFEEGANSATQRLSEKETASLLGLVLKLKT